MSSNFVDYGNATALMGGVADRIEKNYFEGTKEEWEALTDEQKAVYDQRAVHLKNGDNNPIDLSGYQTKNLSSPISVGGVQQTQVEGVISALNTTETTDVQNVYKVNGVVGAKNLLPNLGLATSTDNGITYTKQSDGSVIANGTASKWAYYNLCTSFTLEAGTYIISGKLAKDGTQIKLLNADTSADIVIVSNSQTERTFTLANTTNIHAMLYVGTAAGAVSNFVFKPMLRLATDTDSTYQPYAMTNQQMTPYVQAISNPNLLDNPWFTVNQRGFTSGNTNGYTVDRWRLNVTCTVTVNSDNSITLSKAVGEAPQFVQFVDPTLSEKLDGKTVTLSALIGNTIYKGTFVYENEDNFIYQIPINNEWVLDYRCLNNSATGHIVRFLTSGTTLASDITIKAVKLELGSVSTLAMDTAPNYATELLKCQRYFVRFLKQNNSTSPIAYGATENDNSLRAGLPLPTTLRTESPTISVSDLTKTRIYCNNNTYTPTNITQYKCMGHILHIKIDAASLPSYTAGAFIFVTSGNYLDVSADL